MELLYHAAWFCMTPWHALTHDASNVRLRGGPGSSLEMPGAQAKWCQRWINILPGSWIGQVMYPIR